MPRILLSLFFYLIFQTAFAQEFTAEETREDLAFLRKSIQTYNPALYTYNPDFDAASEQITQEVDGEPVSLIAYFQKVSRMCALSNEGHFKLGDWQDTVHQPFMDFRYRYMPFSIKLISGRFYVDEDYSSEQLMKKGDQILEINGRKPSEILHSFYPYLCSDGHIKTYPNLQIESGFPWLYYLYIEQPESFTLTVQHQGTPARKVLVKAIAKDQQVENYKKYVAPFREALQPEDAFYTLTHTDHYSMLTLPSFDYRVIEKYGVKATRLYKNIFKELQEKGVQRLVIDLRNNTGGRNEFAFEMIPFILKNDHGDEFMKKSVSWEGKEREYRLPRASKYLFKGDIYVFVNGKTYSAGHSLARYLVEYGNAVAIGEESGTRYEGFAAGSTQYVTLPSSQIGIGIPRYLNYYPSSGKQTTKNRGLLPSQAISYTLEDWLNNKDPYLEKLSILLKD